MSLLQHSSRRVLQSALIDELLPSAEGGPWACLGLPGCCCVGGCRCCQGSCCCCRMEPPGPGLGLPGTAPEPARSMGRGEGGPVHCCAYLWQHALMLSILGALQPRPSAAQARMPTLEEAMRAYDSWAPAGAAGGGEGTAAAGGAGAAPCAWGSAVPRGHSWGSPAADAPRAQDAAHHSLHHLWQAAELAQCLPLLTELGERCGQLIDGFIGSRQLALVVLRFSRHGVLAWRVLVRPTIGPAIPWPRGRAGRCHPVGVALATIQLLLRHIGPAHPLRERG
jgi:hypothetical protein